MTLSRRFVSGLAAATALLGAAALPARAAEGDKSIGAATAKVTVIEYASVTCSHCAAWNAEVFPAFKAKYVDTGRARYVLRELPTQPAPVATAGFLVARCAGAKYFTVIDALMKTQATLFESGDAHAWLLQAGAVGGLTEAEVKACVEDEAAVTAFNARIEKNLAEYEVSGTPTVFVNGKVVGAGEIDLATLEAAITAAEQAKRGK
jgi:protein-disulfide isomerase